MAFIQCDFYSNVLKRTVSLNVLLPTDQELPSIDSNEKEIKPLRTLYLLHGYYGYRMDWITGTRLPLWASENNLCVILPSGENSFFVDSPDSLQRFGAFISQDLIWFTRRSFPLSSLREDTAIGGLSMGGYGSIIAGLLHSEIFGHVCAFSSALDMAVDYGLPYNWCQYASSLAQNENLPRFFLSCGIEDSFYHSNKSFSEELKKLSYDVTWVSLQGGHDWNTWDRSIKLAIKWLFQSTELQ